MIYTEVKLVSDDSGHKYLIPATLYDSYRNLMKELDLYEDNNYERFLDKCDEFGNLFGRYCINGNVPKLFVQGVI